MERSGIFSGYRGRERTGINSFFVWEFGLESGVTVNEVDSFWKKYLLVNKYLPSTYIHVIRIS